MSSGLYEYLMSPAGGLSLDEIAASHQAQLDIDAGKEPLILHYVPGSGGNVRYFVKPASEYIFNGAVLTGVSGV